jgi:hypothetical protein
MFVQSHQPVPEPGLPVAGDAPQVAASVAAPQRARPNPPASTTAVEKRTRPVRGNKPALVGSTRKRQPSPSDAAGLGFDSSVPSVTSKALTMFGEKYTAATKTKYGDWDAKIGDDQVVQMKGQGVVDMSLSMYTTGRHAYREGSGRRIPVPDVVHLTGPVVQMSGCRFVRLSDEWIHALPFVGMDVHQDGRAQLEGRAEAPLIGVDGAGNLIEYDETDYRKWCGFYIYDRNGELFDFAFARKDKYAQALLDLKEGAAIALKGIVVELRASQLAGRSVTGKYGLICTEIKYEQRK